jgi:hypothetical protein
MLTTVPNTSFAQIFLCCSCSRFCLSRLHSPADSLTSFAVSFSWIESVLNWQKFGYRSKATLCDVYMATALLQTTRARVFLSTTGPWQCDTNKFKWFSKLSLIGRKRGIVAYACASICSGARKLTSISSFPRWMLASVFLPSDLLLECFHCLILLHQWDPRSWWTVVDRWWTIHDCFRSHNVFNCESS